jgi:hypothetical protein
MESVFSLKSSVEELSSANQGTSRVQLDELPPTRDIVGNNFSNGAINFRFENSGMKWWMPSKSYIKTRMRITKPDGTMLEIADGVAPNMDLMPNLFQSCEFRIQDKVVSRISDFVPQVDALDVRLSKSKAWLDSIGAATNYWQSLQGLRQADVIRTGAVYPSTIPVIQAGAETGRAALGFDAAGASGASNLASYTATTGRIVFTQDGGAALPADVRLLFPLGSYFAYTSGNQVGTVGVRMRVLQLVNASTIRVEAIIAADVAVVGGQNLNFSRFSGDEAVDAFPSRRVSNFETVWQPTLSIFKVPHALPCGKYELVLNPQTSSSWKQRAIESALGQASKVPGVAGQFDVQIVDMYFYCQSVDGPRADDMSYLLDLQQTRCQAVKVDNASFGQKNADISPSTYAITVAYQDTRAGEHTAISASKFKCYEDSKVDPTDANSCELKLNRQFLNYAGQNFPQPDANPEFVAQSGAGAVGGTDYTTQGYVRTQMNSGSYFDTGGSESLKDWQDRGAYYYYTISRDGTDRSTRLNVHSGFQPTTDVSSVRLLMFDHSKQVAKVRIQSGRVVDVQLEDA